MNHCKGVEYQKGKVTVLSECIIEGPNTVKGDDCGYSNQWGFLWRTSISTESENDKKPLISTVIYREGAK